MTESIVSFSSPFTFDWTISNISKLANVYSPEYTIGNAPWKIEVRKGIVNFKQHLGIYLHHANVNVLSNLSNTAGATFKLLSFDKSTDRTIIRKLHPWIFDSSAHYIGFNCFLAWDDLFDGQKKYVKDDAITFKIEAYSNDENKSILKSESLGQFCECKGVAKFRLTVSNIEHLFAVRLPVFKLRDQKCCLTVYKESNELGIHAYFHLNSDEAYAIKITVKLTSSKNRVTPIEKSSSNICKKISEGYLRAVNFSHIISWNELIKPENGYVQNNAITLEVEVEAEKLTLPTVTATKRRSSETQTQSKLIKLECGICESEISDQDTSSTPCGHLFCTPCITKFIKKRKICPIGSCNAKVSANGLRPIYLSISK